MKNNFINKELDGELGTTVSDLAMVEGAGDLIDEQLDQGYEIFQKLGEPDFVGQTPLSAQTEEDEDEQPHFHWDVFEDPFLENTLSTTQRTNPTNREQDPVSRPQDWRLICPPDNWDEPLPITLGEVRLLEMLAQRLNLVVSRDDKRQKIYLGLADGSFWVSSTAPDGASEQDPSSPPRPEGVPVGQGSSGLRFPSRWTADVVPLEEAGSEYEPIDVEAAAPLIPAFPDAQISKNFRLSEFRPGDHTYDLIRLSPMLVNILEEIRKRAGGQQLHVTSGYRPPAYNRKVGGVSNSTHIDGLAADIYSDYISTEELYDICDAVIGDRGGVGYYETQGFIHVDLRGYRARWP